MCVASGFDTFAFSILGRVEVGLMGRLMVIVVVAMQYDFLSAMLIMFSLCHLPFVSPSFLFSIESITTLLPSHKHLALLDRTMRGSNRGLSYIDVCTMWLKT